MGVTDKMTGAELILTRAMSGGKLTANLGKISGSNDEQRLLYRQHEVKLLFVQH
jgi:type IV secretory pathway TraG/TraD family ATPase VirD4